MKKTYLLLMIFILFSGFAFSQVKDNKVKPQCRYNYLQITVGSGFIRPTEIMTDTYNPSASAGFDLSYRTNPEVAVFFEGRYNFLSLVDKRGPTSGYLETTFGPRFYFSSKNVRSTFFIETAIGPYTKFVASYTDSTGQSFQSITEIKLGANGGVGGELVFTDNFYFTLKAKYHTIFGIGGLVSYVSGFGGFTFRF
jgi:hypothetical protein